MFKTQLLYPEEEEEGMVVVDEILGHLRSKDLSQIMTFP